MNSLDPPRTRVDLGLISVLKYEVSVGSCPFTYRLATNQEAPSGAFLVGKVPIDKLIAVVLISRVPITNRRTHGNNNTKTNQG